MQHLLDARAGERNLHDSMKVPENAPVELNSTWKDLPEQSIDRFWEIFSHTPPTTIPLVTGSFLYIPGPLNPSVLLQAPGSP